MNETMTDQEKSVMLARLCGWTVSKGESFISADPFPLRNENAVWVTSLYAPSSMALAWRVSNFVNDEFFNGGDWCDGYFTWWHEVEWYKYIPADAQRAWLDKILELAIAAGMVTE